MSELRDTISPQVVTSTIHVALANARRRGDPWKTQAEEYLGQTETFLKRLDALGMKLLMRYAKASHELEAMTKKVRNRLETLADALWEARGRMQQDPLLAILTSDTPSYFFDWSMGQPADRIDAFLEFLAGCELSSGVEQEVTKELRAILPEYRALGETVRGLRARIDVFEKMVESFSRAGHVQYSRLRRRMRADGFDAFEIRQVFPDISGVSVTGTLG